MTDEAHGGCLCGRIRYTGRNPISSVVCHCKNCQKQSGSAFSINVLFNRSDFELSGALAVFEDRGDSGGVVKRHFCATCGSPIFSSVPSSPDLVILKGGTLDDVRDLPQPSMQAYCSSAQHWVELANAGPRFERAPVLS